MYKRAQRFPDVILVDREFGQRVARRYGIAFLALERTDLAGRRRTHLGFPDVRQQGSRIDVVTQFQPVAHRTGRRRAHRVGTEHGHQFAARRRVAEARQTERRIAPHHRLRIVQQLEQSLVERRVRVVLAHDPGRGLADLQVRTGGIRDHLRIPARRTLAVRHALAQLYQRMLNVARLSAIGEICVQVRIAELAPEPRVVPEEKGK